MEPCDQSDVLNLILRAQRGDKNSLSQVAELATNKVFAYLYRIGLDYHLAQDLCQETMVRFTEYFPRLKIKDEHALWAWLYRAAFSRFQQYGRDATRKKSARQTVVHSDLVDSIACDTHGAFDIASKKELAQTVWKAMNTLKPCYRQVLTLRCFDQLSYAQIAAVTGGSRVRAKVLFFRAKQSLKNQLVRNGFTKGHLLAGLTAFGIITSKTGQQVSAATCVTAASTEVGLGTAVASALATKLGAAVVTIAVAGTLIVNTILPAVWQQASIERSGPVGLSRDIVRQIDQKIKVHAPKYEFINVGLVYDANVVMISSYGRKNSLNKQVAFRGVNPFSATICLQLLEQGKIQSLDDDIRKYSTKYADCLPDHYTDTPITFRHLMTHYSGLPQDDSSQAGPILRTGKLNLQAQPGSQYLYSEAGYAVLEDLLADISGKTYDELLQEYIAEPIKTTTISELQPENPNIAGVTCTISDLVNFLAKWLKGEFISGDLIRTQAWAPQGRDFNGLGWFLLIDPERDSKISVLARSRSALDTHDIYLLAQPCGRLATAMVLQKRRAGQSTWGQDQLPMDMINIIGEQHMQERGGPHQPTWDIP